METAEIRRTDWVSVERRSEWNGSGIAAYRIWQEFTGRDWFQRHEWKRTNGAIEMDKWIPGVRCWAIKALPISDAA